MKTEDLRARLQSTMQRNRATRGISMIGAFLLLAVASDSIVPLLAVAVQAETGTFHAVRCSDVRRPFGNCDGYVTTGDGVRVRGIELRGYRMYSDPSTVSNVRVVSSPLRRAGVPPYPLLFFAPSLVWTLSCGLALLRFSFPAVIDRTRKSRSQRLIDWAIAVAFGISLLAWLVHPV